MLNADAVQIFGADSSDKKTIFGIFLTFQLREIGVRVHYIEPVPQGPQENWLHRP